MDRLEELLYDWPEQARRARAPRKLLTRYRTSVYETIAQGVDNGSGGNTQCEGRTKLQASM